MSIKNPEPDPDSDSDPEQVFLPSRGSCIFGSFVSRIWKFAPDFDELFGHPLVSLLFHQLPVAALAFDCLLIKQTENNKNAQKQVSLIFFLLFSVI